jgi:hypothetical protein
MNVLIVTIEEFVEFRDGWERVRGEDEWRERSVSDTFVVPVAADWIVHGDGWEGTARRTLDDGSLLARSVR